MSVISKASGYLVHFFNAVDEHSLHTPFLYELYTKVIKSTRLNGDYSEIEALRERLHQDGTEISVMDLGAGSAASSKLTRTVADVAKSSKTKPKFSALYYRLIKHFNIRNIVELGTSFGINTLYLAKFEATHVATFEGDSTIANIAQANFAKMDASNIQLIEGNIDFTLSSFLNGAVKPDLFYIDANHQYAATMHYFDLVLRNKHDDSILILDDIYWSDGMKRAWNEIKKSPEVMLSLDLFQCGIVFFKPELTKQHFSLMF